MESSSYSRRYREIAHFINTNHSVIFTFYHLLVLSLSFYSRNNYIIPITISVYIRTIQVTNFDTYTYLHADLHKICLIFREFGRAETGIWVLDIVIRMSRRPSVRRPFFFFVSQRK
jgi:hypothetical protein